MKLIKKAERVKKTFESAIVGAGIGAIVASATNEDPRKAIIAGAPAGLGAHWQSAQKEMELRKLSAKQRERYLNSLAIKRTPAATKKIRILKSEAKKAENSRFAITTTTVFWNSSRCKQG